jgi:hypothetical protein
VEISGDQHAGSNLEARHARGVAGLTIRPLAQALPPDSEWVDVRYRTADGDELEERFEWQRFRIEDEDGGDATGLASRLIHATTLGLDLEQDLVRRATKQLYVPAVVDRQKERRDERFPSPEPPPIARGSKPPRKKGKKAAKKTLARRALSGRASPSRDFPDRDFPDRGFPASAFTARDFPTRDFPTRDFPDRDFASRGFPDRDFPDRTFPSRSLLSGDLPSREPPGREPPDREPPDREPPDRGVPLIAFTPAGFPIRSWPQGADIPTVDGTTRPRGSVAVADGSIESFLPHVFDARAVATSHGDFGYIRIRTFSVRDEWDFLNEFIRLAALVPQGGLIIDVRGNGGGLILAGELMLQTLTPRLIEPECVQFVNSPATRALIAQHSGDSRPFSDFNLGAWKASSELAIQTGATYTQAFPITDPASANLVGQQYHGPVVLITDARCYSTTDIFAAGFQDHHVGPIIGVDGNTGAGGANVWTHDLLRQLFDGVPNNPMAALPKGIEMRVAIRRMLRVGDSAGTPVEDLGVVPDVRYDMSHRDLFEGNVDLFDFAGGALASRRAYRLEIASVKAVSERRRVRVRTENLQRLDVYLEDRPIRSLDIDDGTTQVTVPLEPEDAVLDLRGFDGGTLAAARRAVI